MDLGHVRFPRAWAAAIGLLAAAGPAPAQLPGQADPAFGVGGRVVTPLGGNNDRIQAVQVRKDERIVVAGESASGPNTSNNLTVARYLANGLLDTSFGSGGVTRIDGGGGVVDFARALVLQPDRRILVGGAVTGSAYSDFGVLRLLENGQVDSGFGSGGIARVNMGPGTAINDYATAIAVQASGRIVLAGVAFAPDGAFNYPRFGLVRFEASGAADPSFGSGGSVIAGSPVAGGSDYLTAIARLPSGRLPADDSLTVVGHTAAQNTAIVARYTANGQPDPGFGSGGRVLIQAANTGGVHTGLSVIFAAVLQPDGRLVVAGQGTDRGFAILRLLGNGALDPSFGSGGRAHVKFSGPSSYDEPFAVTVQGNGKIVVAGYFDGPPSEDFAIARLLANGTVDAGFGDGAGRTVLPISASSADRAHGLALAPSGHLLVAGWVQDPQAANLQEDLALARIVGDPDRIFWHDFGAGN